MEYVPGRTLRDVLTAEGPLTPRAALDLFDPILQAIAAAHDAGLIHRDVKPENVILREDGVVKVADFGLARAVTAATTTNASGTLLGTVAYLSPEQVERGIADARSDVYAAGLVLYEMLTGRKAFDGDSPDPRGLPARARLGAHAVGGRPDRPRGARPARRPRHGPRPRQAPGQRRRLPRGGPPVAGDDDDHRARPAPGRHPAARRGRRGADPARQRRRADVGGPGRLAHRPGTSRPASAARFADRHRSSAPPGLARRRLRAARPGGRGRRRRLVVHQRTGLDDPRTRPSSG